MLRALWCQYAGMLDDNGDVLGQFARDLQGDLLGLIDSNFDCECCTTCRCHICALPGCWAGVLAWRYRNMLSLFVWWSCASAAVMMRYGTMMNLEVLKALLSEVQYCWRHKHSIKCNRHTPSATKQSTTPSRKLVWLYCLQFSVLIK